MPSVARAVGVLVGMCLGLVGGPVGAAPPAAPAPAPTQTGEAELLVWSGGKTRAEAESQQEGLSAYLDALQEVLTVNPVVLESAKVEGLKPGFFVVALGLCTKDKLTEPLRIFQALYPDVYTRTVKYKPTPATPALECPQPADVGGSTDAPVFWGLEGAERVVQKGSALVGLAFSYSWDEQGDFARSYSVVKTVYLLIESKTRRLVESKVHDGPSDATTLESFKIEEERIVSTIKYGDPPCSPSTDYFKGWRNQVKVFIAKAEIKLVEAKPKMLDEGSCGFAEEGRMISGEGHNDE